jgi:rod shape-determining protein MreC
MDVLGQDRREGLGRRAESRVTLLTLIFVSILLLLSSLYSAEASVFRKARETVMDAAAPALEMFSGPINYIQKTVGDVRDYINVMKQNQALREENAELRQWMNEALALRETVAAYEALSAYHAPPGVHPINAVVIGESNDVYSHSMLVNAGGTDGVKRGQAVIDATGLVGRIVDVGQNAARVLLLTDVQSRAPVYIEGADVEGLLVGRTKARPAISFTESSEPVIFKPGQRVLTSGAGGVLPRGIPIGVVAAESEGEAIVELYANYARTRLVRVVNYQFPELEPDEAEAPVAVDEAVAIEPEAAQVTANAPAPAALVAAEAAPAAPEAAAAADADEETSPEPVAD